MKCTDCKYKGHCDDTGSLYGLPKWNGGCVLYEKKKPPVSKQVATDSNYPLVNDDKRITEV